MHFIFPYPGNKRKEFGNFNLNYDGITRVVEPFAGSAAVSFNIAKLYPGRFDYVLNDNSAHLIDMYKILQDEKQIDSFNDDINAFITEFNEFKTDIERKPFYLSYVRRKDLIGYFIKNKYYCMHAGVYPLIKNKALLKKLDLREYPIYDFLKKERVVIRFGDGLNILKEYKDDFNTMLILDPPYLNSFNDYYQSTDTNIYEYLYNNNINDMKANIILILENNWIIKLLFKDIKNIIIYNKKYEVSKKKVKHIIIKNERSEGDNV